MSPKIIFEDDDLLIIDKPAGLVVDKSETQTENTLENWLEDNMDSRFRGNDKLDRQGIVHRLDKDTSGLLLVAKTIQALENLQAQFKQRTIKKEYMALVHGEITESGVVNAAISRNPNNREKFIAISSDQSKGVNVRHLEGDSAWHLREAETEYSPVGNFKFSILNFQSIFSDLNEQSSRAGFHPLTKIQLRKLERMNYNQFTLLSCFPQTGRTHQIRVHLKYINHPVVSDEKYVGRKMYRLDKRWCPRLFLHARKLEFKHPTTGQWMKMESELPEDLEKALKNLHE